MFYANKSLKNKIIPAILSFLLLLTAVSPLFTSKAYAQNFPVLSGITYLNMPEKTFGGKTTQCKLTITNFNLNKNKFSLSGIVSYSNRNYPLNIEGTLYKSRIGKNNFVALTKDTTNTFDVLHFSILFNPDIHFLVTKKMRDFVSKETTSGIALQKSLPLITIYLKRKNTREVSFVEGKLLDNDIFGSNFERDIFMLNDTVKSKSKYSGEDYYTCLFLKPITYGLHTLDKTTSNGYIGSDTYNYEYSETYVANQEGDAYTYYIDFQATQKSGDSEMLIRTDHWFLADLKVLSVGTRSNNPIYASNYSPFLLGGPNDPVIIKVRAYADGTSNSDRLIYAEYSGNFNRFQSWYSGLNLSIGISVGVASISWTPPLHTIARNARPDYEIYLDNNPDKNPSRLAVYEYNKLYLKYTGDDFISKVVDRPDLGSGQSYRYFEILWSVPIYAKYSALTPYSERETKSIYTYSTYTVTGG